MKLNKILYIVLVIVMATACRDENLENLPELQDGATVMFESITSPIIDFSQIGTSAFLAKLGDRNGNIVKYDLFVSHYRAGISSDTLFMRTITSFPNDLSITAADAAAALNMDVADFEAGDRFDFVSTLTRSDGSTYNYTNVGDDLTNPGQMQAIYFSVYLSCAYDPVAIEGTYQIIVDEWGAALNPEVEVVAGPSATQFTIKDVLGFGQDLIVDINTVTGQISTDRFQTWTPQFFGFPANYGKGYMVGDAGFAFSCSGTITFSSVTYSVDLGTFPGTYVFTLQKL